MKMSRLPCRSAVSNVNHHADRKALLAALPVEILNHILSFLCLHCRDTQCLVDDAGHRSDCDALLALTQTNRLCRSIAMPILFHYPNSHLSSSYIFNLLNCQPDLLKHIRSLDLPVSKRSKPCDSTLLAKIIAERIIHRPYPGPVMNDGLGSAESSLLLSLCFNLTRLVIDDDGVFDLSKYSPSQWGSSKYLMHLKYLEIKVRSVEAWSGPIILSLLQASPKLEVLVFNGEFIGRWHPDCQIDLDLLRPVLENLKEIRLLGSILSRGPGKSPRLADLISAARNLQTFKFIVDRSGNWKIVDQWVYVPRRPTHFIGMLKAARTSLKHLALNFDTALVRFDSNSMFIDPNEIREFVQLQTLEIDQFCYCKHQLIRDNVKEPWDRATHLADLLPTTVKKLKIFWKPALGVYLCLDCILYLGKRAVAGDFPRLESVQVDAPVIPNKMFSAWDQEPGVNNWKGKIDLKVLELEGQARQFKEAFEGSGVATSFRIWNAVDNVSAYME